MANENENLNSPIEEINLAEINDIDVLKEHYQKLGEAHQKTSDSNKQLFERTKKAEGFELKDDKWVKTVPKETKETEPKVETKSSKEPSKPSELDWGQLAFHNSKSDSIKIEDSEDVEFLKKTIEDTGKSQDSIVSSNWFTAELKEKQAERVKIAGTPKSKKRTGQSGASDDTDRAMAEFERSGDLPKDFKTKVKVIDKITAKEEKALFSGPNVIGGGAIRQ